jgi:hypothetical protein
VHVFSEELATSDQSDCERRVHALQQELLRRKAEIGRLLKEQKRKRLHARELQLSEVLEVRKQLYMIKY